MPRNLKHSESANIIMKTKNKPQTETILSEHLKELTIIAATAIDELTIKYGDDYGKTLNRQLSRVLGKIRSGK